MNKLAVLAFALLLFFSSMLWFLANGSLNQYLKSQVQLQGKYYSGQSTALTKAKFSPNALTANFTDLQIENIQGFSQRLALVVDQANADIASVDTVQVANLTIVNKLIIDNVKINLEYKNRTSNIELLLQKITETLAKDFPSYYPEISAKHYAKEHPERNAELAEKSFNSSQNKVETNAAIAAKQAKQKSTRGKKVKTRIIVKNITIQNLHIAVIKQGNVSESVVNNVSFTNIGGNNGFESNQLGGELLKLLFEQAQSITKQ